jgi:hypothetical protein
MLDETHLVVSRHYWLVKMIQSRRASTQRPDIGLNQSIIVLIIGRKA